VIFSKMKMISQIRRCGDTLITTWHQTGILVRKDRLGNKKNDSDSLDIATST